jgi:homoserine kinase type II
MVTEDSNKTAPMLFLVIHERSGSTESSEDLKIIGVFSSRGMAEKAVKELTDKPGFKDYPDGFTIDAYKADAVFWGDGFVI